MSSCRKQGVICLAVLATLVVAGCSNPEDGRMEVTGRVQLVAEPLKEGTIRFVPLDKPDTGSGALIVNGAYKVPRKQGLKPGKYLVQITAPDGKTPASEEVGGPGSSNIVSLDRIPEEWNVRSTQQVEVKTDAVNTFDFDIRNLNPRLKKR